MLNLKKIKSLVSSFLKSFFPDSNSFLNLIKNSQVIDGGGHYVVLMIADLSHGAAENLTTSCLRQPFKNDDTDQTAESTYISSDNSIDFLLDLVELSLALATQA